MTEIEARIDEIARLEHWAIMEHFGTIEGLTSDKVNRYINKRAQELRECQI